MKRPKAKTGLAYPRTRNMGLIKSHALQYNGGAYPSGGAYSGTVAVGAISGLQKEIKDIVTPGYRQLVKAGVRINNPMDIYLLTSTPYLANSYYRSNSTGWEVLTGPVVSWIMGRLDLNLPDSTVPVTNLSTLATIKVWNRVEPAKSQSLVTALEAHKSWDTILNRAKKLAAIVVACRKGNLRELKRLMPGTPRKPISTKVLVWDDDGKPLLTKRGKLQSYRKSTRVFSSPGNLDVASRLWLEYRYGWTPLVLDIVDTLKAVFAADLRNELPLTKDIGIARSQEKDSRTVTTSATYVAGGLTYTGNREAVYEWSVRTYIHYRWKAPDGILRRMNDFGLFDVPRAVWELTPFSFLADRIIPIGEWLGALTPKIGVEILGMGHTVTDKVTARQWIASVPAVNPPGAPPANRWAPACPVGSQDSMERTVVTRKTFLGTPYLPPIDVKIGIKQMVDVAALFKSIR